MRTKKCISSHTFRLCGVKIKEKSFDVKKIKWWEKETCCTNLEQGKSGIAIRIKRKDGILGDKAQNLKWIDVWCFVKIVMDKGEENGYLLKTKLLNWICTQCALSKNIMKHHSV